LISLHDVEEKLYLGPNSSFLYCFNFLENNLEWLKNKINESAKKGKKYLIIDTPGQIEIFTLSNSFKNIVKYLTNEKNGLNVRLCAVNLIESNNLCDLPRYVFSILSVLNVMINLELPQINVISKFDLLKEFRRDKIKDNTNDTKYSKESAETNFEFPLSFYKNPINSELLNEQLDLMNINPKFKKLNKLISEFVIDYGLVSFDFLDVKDQKRLNKIASLVDKANGYIYLDTGRLQDEKYIDIRNKLAKDEWEFDQDECEFEGNGEGY